MPELHELEEYVGAKVAIRGFLEAPLHSLWYVKEQSRVGAESHLAPSMGVLMIRRRDEVLLEAAVQEGPSGVSTEPWVAKVPSWEGDPGIGEFALGLGEAEKVHRQIAGWWLSQYPSHSVIFALTPLAPVSIDLSPAGMFGLATEPITPGQGQGACWSILCVEPERGRYHLLVMNAISGTVLACHAGINPNFAGMPILLASFWWLMLKILLLVTAMMALVLVVGLCVEAAAAAGMAFGAFLLANGLQLAAIILALTQVIGWLINVLNEFLAMVPPPQRQTIQNRINRLRAIEQKLDDDTRTPQQHVGDIKSGLGEVKDALQDAKDSAHGTGDPEGEAEFEEEMQELLDEVEKLMNAIEESGG